MEKIVFIIIGCAVVTYLPRFLPLYILTRLEIPSVVIAWLRYIPVAVLAALIVPGVAASEGVIHFSLSNAYLLASLPAFFIAWRTRNMLYTVVVGMAAVLVLQQFL